MLPPLPRCSRWAHSSLEIYPSVSAFPNSTFGSACTSTFSRIARRSLALRPAHSHGHQIRDRYPRASDISSPPCLPRLLPAGAVAGRGLHPLENAALSRRTWESGHSVPCLGLPDAHRQKRAPGAPRKVGAAASATVAVCDESGRPRVEYRAPATDCIRVTLISGTWRVTGILREKANSRSICRVTPVFRRIELSWVRKVVIWTPKSPAISTKSFHCLPEARPRVPGLLSPVDKPARETLKNPAAGADIG